MKERNESKSKVIVRPHIFFDQLSHWGKPGQVKSIQNRNITIAKYKFWSFLKNLPL